MMRFLFSVLMLLLGGAAGAGLGLGSGLVWVELAGTSGFEGYSGYVVAMHMLVGIVLGAIIGMSLALRWTRVAPPAI